jgi:hypothetical protein
LLIDLSEVTHIDAAGIDILANAAARVGEADIALCIAGLHGAVKDALLTHPEAVGAELFGHRGEAGKLSDVQVGGLSELRHCESQHDRQASA